MTDSWDLIGTDLQGPVKTHGRSACEGQNCCVHNPSDHHMVDWPLSFDMSFGAMGERHCRHGDRHPDPDSVKYMRSVWVARTMTASQAEAGWIGTHSCDGCCMKETAKTTCEREGHSQVEGRCVYCGEEQK